MDEWSTLFTVIALAGVLLTLFGAWWAVRTMRGRKPRPGRDEREPERRHAESPGDGTRSSRLGR